MDEVFPDVSRDIVLRELSRPGTVWIRTSDTKTIRTSASVVVEMGNVKVLSHSVPGTRLRAGVSIEIDGAVLWQKVSTNGVALAVVAVCTVKDTEYDLHSVWVSNAIRVLKAVPKGCDPNTTAGNIILAGKRMTYVER